MTTELSPSAIKKLAADALREDMPKGDLTTDHISASEPFGRGRVIAKEDLVLSGQAIFTAVFSETDPSIKLDWQFKDGDFIFTNQTVCTFKGDLRSVLKAERTALNFLGRLSGIATLTRCFAEKVQHTQTKILDTRKTTPGLRELEKMAVRHGGGVNHRMNLSDDVLIKENHIRLSGGLKQAVESVRRGTGRPIAVEVRNLAEVKAAIEAKAERVLLDNMSNDDMREALRLLPPTVTSEASGNMTLERVQSVAETGVNFISVGALTHSAPCADLSLLFD